MSGRAARGPAVRDAVAVLGVYLLLGVAGGVVWWLLWHPATFTKVEGRGSMAEDQLARMFDADGWYAVIAIVAGTGAGFAITLWRGRDPVLTTALVAVAAGLAAVAMAATGHLLGPGDPDAALAAAEAGAQVPAQLSISAQPAYLAWPISSLVGALLVLWSTPKRTPPEPNRQTRRVGGFSRGRPDGSAGPPEPAEAAEVRRVAGQGPVGTDP